MQCLPGKAASTWLEPLNLWEQPCGLSPSLWAKPEGEELRGLRVPPSAPVCPGSSTQVNNYSSALEFNVCPTGFWTCFGRIMFFFWLIYPFWNRNFNLIPVQPSYFGSRQVVFWFHTFSARSFALHLIWHFELWITELMLDQVKTFGTVRMK